MEIIETRKNITLCTYFGHSIVYVHGSDPTTKTLRSTRDWGNSLRVEVSVAGIVGTNNFHDSGWYVVLVVTLQTVQEVHVTENLKTKQEIKNLQVKYLNILPLISRISFYRLWIVALHYFQYLVLSTQFELTIENLPYDLPYHNYELPWSIAYTGGYFWKILPDQKTDPKKSTNP